MHKQPILAVAEWPALVKRRLLSHPIPRARGHVPRAPRAWGRLLPFASPGRLALLLGLLLPMLAQGQGRKVKPKPIEASEAPAGAVEFIKPLQFETQVKWYRVAWPDRPEFLVRFKEAGLSHQAVFGPEGDLRRIEVESDLEELPAEARTTIKAVLQEAFSKYRVRKTARHFTGDIPNLYSFLASGEPEADYTLQYRLLVRGRSEAGQQTLAFTFDADGAELSRRPGG